MLKLIFLSLIFTSILSFNQAYSAAKLSKNHYNEHTVNSIVNSKKLKINKSDLRLANNLASVYRVARGGYINKTTVSRLYRKIKKNKTFSIYKQWLSHLLTIKRTNTLGSIKNLCQKIERKKSVNPVTSRLLYNSKQLCFQKYLDKLGKNRLSYQRLKKELPFFKKYIAHYTTYHNLDELIYILDVYDNNPKRKSLLSKNISSHFIKQDKLPQNKLLKNLSIDHELTKYIQIKGMDENSTGQIIYAEFKELVEDAYKSADDNDDHRVVSAKVNKALNYYNLSFQYLSQFKSSHKLIGLGKSLMRRSYFKSSRKLFKGIIKNSISYKTEATFELLWSYLTQEDYEGALENVIKKYKLVKKLPEHSSSKLSFWVAYTLKEEDQGEYKDILTKIITHDPVSYYSIISSKLLEETSNKSSNKTYLSLLKSNQQERYFTDLKVDRYTYRALKRLKIWAHVDFKPFISSERRAINNIYTSELIRLNKNHPKEKIKDFLTFLAAKVVLSTNNYLEVFKITYRSINNKRLTVDEEVLNLLYPTPFLPSIKRYAQEIDPIIPLSLIRQESSFNPRARSHVGARGLMQLMPYTARQYRKRLRTSRLYNSNLNLSIGTKYFRKLYKQYDNNLVYTLSAYNAGEGRVKRWRNRYLTSESILHNIENIPFSETRKYVKLIFRNIYFYKLLKKKQSQLKLADTNKVNKIFDVYLGFNR